MCDCGFACNRITSVRKFVKICRIAQYQHWWTLLKPPSYSVRPSVCTHVRTRTQSKDEISVLLRCYTAYIGNYLSTFRYNLSVSSSWAALLSNMGPIGCPETSVRNYHYPLRNNPEDHSAKLLRGGSPSSRSSQTCSEPLQLDRSCQNSCVLRKNCSSIPRR